MTRDHWRAAVPAAAALASALVLVAVTHGGPDGDGGAGPALARLAALVPPGPAEPTALADAPRFPSTPPECVLPLTPEPPPECHTAADCDDGLWCDGVEACTGGRCVAGAAPCEDDGQWCNGVETCDELAQTCGQDRVPRCTAEGRVCDEVTNQCALSVDLVAWVSALVDTLPDRDSERYVVPSRGELLDFEDAVRALFAGDRVRAAESAAMIGYEVVALLDSEMGDELLWGLLPAPENHDGRGIYVVRPTSTTIRELVVEAPHPRYDLGTGVMAARLFRDTGGRAFAMAGTHRCANGEATSCDGVTSVCNEGHGPYRASDVAHVERSFFQTFHEVATSVRPETTLVLQVHGFASHEGAPAFFISDGTDHDADDDYLPNRLARAIEARVKARGRDQRGSSCNRAGDADRYCGDTNTQGRHTNGIRGDRGVNACVAAPERGVGRFLHLELCYDLRHEGGVLDPDVIVEATTAAIPEIEVAHSPSAPPP